MKWNWFIEACNEEQKQKKQMGLANLPSDEMVIGGYSIEEHCSYPERAWFLQLDPINHSVENFSNIDALIIHICYLYVLKGVCTWKSFLIFTINLVCMQHAWTMRTWACCYHSHRSVLHLRYAGVSFWIFEFGKYLFILTLPSLRFITSNLKICCILVELSFNLS